MTHALPQLTRSEAPAPLAVGQDAHQATDKLLTQHERDLEVLGRIEDERLCFFCSMAALHAQQKREAGL